MRHPGGRARTANSSAHGAAVACRGPGTPNFENVAKSTTLPNFWGCRGEQLAPAPTASRCSWVRSANWTKGRRAARPAVSKQGNAAPQSKTSPRLTAVLDRSAFGTLRDHGAPAPPSGTVRLSALCETKVLKPLRDGVPAGTSSRTRAKQHEGGRARRREWVVGAWWGGRLPTPTKRHNAATPIWSSRQQPTACAAWF